MKRNRFDQDERLETPFSFKHLKRAGKYIKRNAALMIGALRLSAVGSILSLLGPTITQKALDEAVPNKDMQSLISLALMFLGVNLISTLITIIHSRMMSHASQNIIYDIRKDLFAKLQKLPFSYYDDRPAGKILVRVVNYVNSVSTVLSGGIVMRDDGFVDILRQYTDPRLEIMIPRYNQVLGACVLCAEQCGVKIDGLIEKLAKQY